MSYMNKSGIEFATPLVDFIEQKCLPGTGLDVNEFWRNAAGVFKKFAPINKDLLAVRDDLQAKIDVWHNENPGVIADMGAYTAFLKSIGYLVPEPAKFSVTTENADPEIATMAGPQLVVPVLNARFALNAANARWGSLYDALYGTDVLDSKPQGKGFDAVHGGNVIVWAKDYLDKVLPLASGSHTDVEAYKVVDGALSPALKDAGQFVGYVGDAGDPSVILCQKNGMHIQLVINRDGNIGKGDKAGLNDVVLESALTTICDMEDSITAVDVGDKIDAYTNWLGLMRGNLEETFEKGGKSLTRKLAADLTFTKADGGELTLSGRAVLLVRNVGHLMTNDAVKLADGSEGPEGILDAIVTSLIAMHDVKRNSAYVNSRAGSIYIVKPKMHGPDEAALTNDLFDAVEDMLGLERHTIKVGVMDEERRTSANLAACIKAVSGRIMFINTGFLDRTGDEFHTSMRAGAFIRKAEVKNSGWIQAYEARNVQIGLDCGLSGRAQIGKGMWAAPDMMADMLEQKIGHPKTGANTAWVPSPTAATLHAMHYHDVDVFGLRAEIAGRETPALATLMTPPIATDTNWPDDIVQRELENNAQGILGYVVRWIDSGIGCSKVPDMDDVGLMEDRATLRISSQHIANWLTHDICTEAQVNAAFEKMAAKVDGQNADDASYTAMSDDFANSIAFKAAKALVFEGVVQPNGYTEPLLHAFRILKKQEA
ncbi:MAG: malate synthase G [Alphaproteobacteria bacterium]|nr:malate synthase G [Alphaproteobacteria bacterium]